MQPKTVATCPVTALRPGGPCEIIGGWSGKACTARLNYEKRCGRVRVGQHSGGRRISKRTPPVDAATRGNRAIVAEERSMVAGWVSSPSDVRFGLSGVSVTLTLYLCWRVIDSIEFASFAQLTYDGSRNHQRPAK